MTIYVDPLMNHGWVIRGRKLPNCHLFTDSVDLAQLHALAERIGMRRAWFQAHPSAPHYDLTPSRRREAIAVGAIEVDRRRAVEIWRQRRVAVLGLSDAPHSPPTSPPATAPANSPAKRRFVRGTRQFFPVTLGRHRLPSPMTDLSMSMACPRCSALCSDTSIRVPGDLWNTICIVRAKLADGTLADASENSTATPSFPQVASGDEWGRPFFFRFHCTECRQAFVLELAGDREPRASWRAEAVELLNPHRP